MGACGSSGCGGCGCGSETTARGRRPVARLSNPFLPAGEAPGFDAVSVAREATALLREAGVPSPEADGALLTSHVLGVGAGALIAAPCVTGDARATVLAAAARRAEREPLQHITGEAGFRHLDLHVGPGVFVPRPETEVVVEAALEALPRSGPVRVVDFGAGSGAISLALATERSDTMVFCVELDAGAIPWLTQNVMRHADLLRSRGSRMTVVLGDAGSVCDDGQPMAALQGAIDLVVANPPYIPEDLQPRDPEVRDYDPPLALYGGADGLDVVRRWLDAAAELLAPGAALVMEHGDLQGGDDGVPGLLARHEDLAAEGPVWASVSDHLDLTGRSRYTIARRAGG